MSAAPQWEVVEEAAQVIKPTRNKLIRRVAQDTVVHNDDMQLLHSTFNLGRVIKLAR
jgi:hypothetical protein